MLKKKTSLITLLALLCMTQAVAQTYEYVPFVREGVKWVYYYDNPYEPFDDEFIPFGRHYYTLELKGDAVFNGKHYKPMHLYSGTAINVDNDTVPVYLREENKVVYALVPDETFYAECPIGRGCLVTYEVLGCPIEAGQEYILYDFNDPEGFYSAYGYSRTDTVRIANKLRKRFMFRDNYYGKSYIIEGIGYATGDSPGEALNYFNYLTTGLQVVYNLSRVIEGDDIVYWNPSAAIVEVVADKTLTHDPNYYNLMGQPVGKDLPTTTGIYIHHRNKICISPIP